MNSLSTISMIEVKSSQIRSVGHDAPTSTLAVQFKERTGAAPMYHYGNVPPEMFAALRDAASPGAYLKSHIKAFPLKFPFKRIDVPAVDKAESK